MSGKKKNFATLSSQKKNRSFTEASSNRLNETAENLLPRKQPDEVPEVKNVPVKSQNFDKKKFLREDFENETNKPDSSPRPRVSTFLSKYFSGGKRLPKLASKQGVDGTLKPTPIPIIVVTDIGADIDDTLALFILLGGSDAVKIEAVVTSVNNGIDRGRVTRGFLRLLGVADDSVEILPSLDGNGAACHVPDGFVSSDRAVLGNVQDTPRRILEICEQHQETGIYLFGISSVTPVADAIKLDKHGVIKKALRKVYLQGNTLFSPDDDPEQIFDSSDKVAGRTVRLIPNQIAYNFKNDMEACTILFDYLQDDVSFTFVGKHAAYNVPIMKKNFSAWTHLISRAAADTTNKQRHDVRVPKPPDLLLTAKRQMKRFRDSNQEKFDAIYHVPHDLTRQQIDDFEWFDTRPMDFVCSHPYDPLLALKIVMDARHLQGRVPEKAKPLFQEFTVENKNGHFHTLLGNSRLRSSIVDRVYVHKVLVKHVAAGLKYHGGGHYGVESDKASE